MKKSYQLAAAIAAGLFVAQTGRAQSCKPSDTLSSNVIYELRRIASTDNGVRQKLRLPRVKASEVSIVTDTAICNRVRQALDSMIIANTPDPINLGPRPIYAIRIGSAYAAINPGSQMGEYTPIFVFDRRLTFVSSLAF